MSAAVLTSDPTAWERTRLEKEMPNDAQLTVYLKPMWCLIDAVQNAFAARADCCTKPYDQADHPPVAKLANVMDMNVKPDAKISLGAEEASDPDGNALIYRWWERQEAATYPGSFPIENADKQHASMRLRTDAISGQTIHIICEVTDNGTPPLTRHQRVVMTVQE